MADDALSILKQKYPDFFAYTDHSDIEILSDPNLLLKVIEAWKYFCCSVHLDLYADKEEGALFVSQAKLQFERCTLILIEALQQRNIEPTEVISFMDYFRRCYNEVNHYGLNQEHYWLNYHSEKPKFVINQLQIKLQLEINPAASEPQGTIQNEMNDDPFYPSRWFERNSFITNDQLTQAAHKTEIRFRKAGRINLYSEKDARKRWGDYCFQVKAPRMK